MRELKINLWDMYDTGNIIVITTNGTIKKNGEAVMGRGCAREAKDRYPSIPKILGNHLLVNGNVPGLVRPRIFTLPVKHNWWETADLQLIEESLIKLVQMIEGFDVDVYLPRPGCGNGHLDWETQVKPLCQKHLDYRFIVVTKD